MKILTDYRKPSLSKGFSFSLGASPSLLDWFMRCGELKEQHSCHVKDNAPYFGICRVTSKFDSLLGHGGTVSYTLYKWPPLPPWISKVAREQHLCSRFDIFLVKHSMT